MAGKLRRANPYWMHHSHASHALARGAGLKSRARQPAPYLDRDHFGIPRGGDINRARQITEAGLKIVDDLRTLNEAERPFPASPSVCKGST